MKITGGMLNSEAKNSNFNFNMDENINNNFKFFNPDLKQEFVTNVNLFNIPVKTDELETLQSPE
jgi:hypothetical protein